MDTDVIIVGRGIAALVLSLLLKQKGIDHLVLDREGKVQDFALAETLPPSALPLLKKMGLLHLFESTAIQKMYGYHSVWGSAAVVDNNFFTHRPYQYGLKINKHAIISELETQQKEHLLHFGKELTLHYSDNAISVTIDHNNQPLTITGKIIVDATGRKRALLHKMGISAQDNDNLMAFSCHIPFIKHPKLVHSVYVEAFKDGWGIVSRLNEQENVMTLFTHLNDPIQPLLKHIEHWPAIVQDTKYLKYFLTATTGIRIKGSKANSSRALSIAGKNWLAVGDAAMSFDPLSSHGITNALFTAHQAATAITQQINEGNKSALYAYGHTLDAIFTHYLQTKDHLYKTERRWPESAFWG